MDRRAVDASLLESESRWGQPDHVEEYTRWMAPTARLDQTDLEIWTSF
jgi:hypothetical protein